MAQQLPEVERLLRDIDKILSSYSQSTDRDVRNVIRRLKRRRAKIDPRDLFDTGFKILVLADKIREWIDRLP